MKIQVTLIQHVFAKGITHVVMFRFSIYSFVYICPSSRFLGQEPDINQSQCIVWGSTWNDIRWHISKAM